MALGGGVFIGQSKTLPGAYINFISLARANASLSERGTAAMALELDWQAEGEVFEVTSEDFVKNSLGIFGYDYSREEMRGLRELFRNAETLYAYRLGKGGVKAECRFGAAKYPGIRGNDLLVAIGRNEGLYEAALFLGGTEVDRQTVSSAAELKDNGFVVWDKDADLEITAGAYFTGGKNGDVTFADYQAFLGKIGCYTVNALGVCSDDGAVKALVSEYAKNTRDSIGVKLQCVVYDYAADYEGVVSVKNPVIGGGSELVYWVTGVIAGTAVNKSALNKVYDGEYEIYADYSQKELEAAIKAGEFTLHKVGKELRVLADINSLVTVSDEKGEVFKDNQTIRVIDQIAGDIAALFNSKYLGSVPNDESGRISLWADIVKHHEQLAKIRAIESFADSDVEVLPGDDKRSVAVKDRITVVNAMAQVYMTCLIM